MATLYLIRHGENPANVHHILSWRKADFRLTARGVRQVVEARSWLGDLSDFGFWTSPLRRAVHTAELLAPSPIRPRILEGLRELACGDLDGSGSSADREAFYRVIAAWRAGVRTARFPGGESLATATERLRAALLTVTVADPDGSAVVAGHGGLFTEGLRCLLEDDDRRRFEAMYEPRWLNCEVARLHAHLAHGGALRLSLCRWYGKCRAVPVSATRKEHVCP